MKGSLTFFTWLVRLLTGGVFVYSGFVKAIDPWGTFYKLQDYMAAMHLPDYPNLLLVAAFLLSGYEFCVGVFLILGCFRRSAPICAALFMGVMLPLTLWIAVWNPVEDCGCFGDAIVISNWATFWKNVVLSLAVVWLLLYNARLRWLIRPHLQWMALLVSGAYVVAIGLCGYIYQPLIDFRPYPAGSELVAESDEPEESDVGIRLIYSRDGVEKAFSIDDELPSEEDGWEFVRRETDESAAEEATAGTAAEAGSATDEESTFRVWSDDGEDDLTDDVILRDGDQLILFMPDLKNVSVATTWQINSLQTWANRHGIDMVAVVSASPEEIAEWRDISLAAYPLYTAEDTEIKMVVRGNPAVIFLHDGRIVWKSSLRALNTEDFLSPKASGDISDYARNDKALLYNTSAIYLTVMAVLAFLSNLQVFGRMYPHVSRRLSRGGKGAREESTHPDTPAQ